LAIICGSTNFLIRIRVKVEHRSCLLKNPWFLELQRMHLQYPFNPWNSKWWKHTMVTPFGVSHYTTFMGCACLSVSHFKILKYFHNIFAYYVKI
jgi:hypothetical protein